MKIAPELNSLKDSTFGFFKALGPVFSIALVIFVGIAIWFLVSWAWTGFQEHQVNKQIDEFKKQAEQSQATADQAKQERDQALGAAAVYKQQADALEAQRQELLNARPDLQKKIEETGKAVDAIRNRPIRPIDSNIDQRIKDLGAKLDTLYP